MPSKKATFGQKDLTRACKGVLDAGLPVASVRIDKDGAIEVLTHTDQKNNPNPCDALLIGSQDGA